MKDSPVPRSAVAPALRAPSLVAGTAIIAMAIIAPLVNFLGLAELGGMDFAGLAAHQASLRLAVLGFLVVAILDVLAAWGIHYALRDAAPALSTLSAIFRLAYAVLLVAALGDLARLAAPAVRIPGAVPQEALPLLPVGHYFDGFQSLWKLALALFGLHLALLGPVLARSPSRPRVLAGLVALAGLGYFVDTILGILVPERGIVLSTFTFPGELLLAFWLVARGLGFKLRVPGNASPATTAG